MIDLYYWPTPNGHKITLFLEEAGLPYRLNPVNISAGEQFKPRFLAISPNNRMPAIVDHSPPAAASRSPCSSRARSCCTSPQKTEQFIPEDIRGQRRGARVAVLASRRPRADGGPEPSFLSYAPEKIPYAIERYVKETNRLYGVLDRRLADREFVAGAYSIADMAAIPGSCRTRRRVRISHDFPNLKRWFAAIRLPPGRPFARTRRSAKNSRQPGLVSESRPRSWDAPGSARRACIVRGEPAEHVGDFRDQQARAARNVVRARSAPAPARCRSGAASAPRRIARPRRRACGNRLRPSSASWAYGRCPRRRAASASSTPARRPTETARTSSDRK